MAKKVTQTSNAAIADGGSRRIVAKADLTGPYVAELEAALTGELNRIGSGGMIFDLCAVKQIDSHGIGLCIGLSRECKARRIGLHMTASADLFQFFKLLKFANEIDIREEPSV